MTTFVRSASIDGFESLGIFWRKTFSRYLHPPRRTHSPRSDMSQQPLRSTERNRGKYSVMISHVLSVKLTHPAKFRLCRPPPMTPRCIPRKYEIPWSLILRQCLSESELTPRPAFDTTDKSASVIGQYDKLSTTRLSGLLRRVLAMYLERPCGESVWHDHCRSSPVWLRLIASLDIHQVPRRRSHPKRAYCCRRRAITDVVLVHMKNPVEWKPQAFWIAHCYSRSGTVAQCTKETF